jgi:heat shock protein HslJ
MTTVRLTDNIAYGQLNNQAVAAVVLVTDPGGSGTFYDLAVVVNQNGTPTNVATTSLGDRVQINSSNVENNQIVVDMVQAGPDDPLCCPSQQVLKTFELQGDQLVEVSSQVTESESSPELVDTIWRWDQTLMNNDDTFVPDNPNNYTVQFLPDGTVSIQADCNRVGGSYTTDGSSITIETGPTTLVACPPGSLGDEFETQLSGAAIYFIEDQNLFLDLKFDSGTMRFSAQSTELAGTSWIVTGYNNGREAVVSVIIGSEITANFGADGQLTGSAGCNNYFASYTTDGDNITIGPAGSTQQFCSEPEGIMAQEQEYLTALQTAATYSNRGDTLDLRTASGARAAAFQAVQ